MEQLKEAISTFKDGFPLYADKCLKLVNNKGELVPFKLNHQQTLVHEAIEKQKAETGKVRLIILKSRKLGMSTYTSGRFIHATALNKHKRAAVVTHVTDSTNALFRIYKRFHDNLPVIVRPNIKRSNSKELEFDAIDSSIKVTTAGSSESGRGDTIHYLHCSEMAFWPNSYEIAASLLRSVADVAGTEIIVESTPCGIGSLFYDMWVDAEAGENGYIPIFLPWTLDPECSIEPPPDWVPSDDEVDYQALHKLTNGQLFWRRVTMRQLGEDKFRQEYPINVAEAFRSTSGDTFILPEPVLKARKRELPPEPKNMPLVLGVDVASAGKDKTCIIWRRGNTVEKYVKLSQLENDQVANYLIPILQKDNPAKVFIDGTGGYGGGVAACLRLRGYSSEEIHFSESPTDPQYANKRAEMYGELRNWLKGEVSLPDEDEIEQDLTSFGYKHNSAGKLLLESKADVKKRLKRSPDIGDALALTFAYPIGPHLHATANGSWIAMRERQPDYAW
ncbi:hypothetical protein [Methylobacter sp.]|uniref:hypothetical protein n=1 Tax=Methylobacter sp. TaxID=2051955 RepID=UPI003DA55184